MSIIKTLAILAACGAMLCTGLRAGEAADEQPRPLKIGVVDLEKLFTDYRLAKELEGELRAEAGRQEDELRKQKEVILEHRRRLAADTRDPDNLDRMKESQKLEYELAEYRSLQEDIRAKIAASRFKNAKKIWSEIEDAVARYAKQKGLDLVIKDQVPINPIGSGAELQAYMNSKAVIYRAPYLDCTAEVLKVLNTDYERGRTAVPEKPPAKGGETPKSGKK